MNDKLRKLLLKYGKVSTLKRGNHLVDGMRFCCFCGRELSSFDPKTGNVETYIGHYHVVYQGKSFDFCMNKYPCRKRW